MDHDLESSGATPRRHGPSAVILSAVLATIAIGAIALFALFGGQDSPTVPKARATMAAAQSAVESCATARIDATFVGCDRAVADELPDSIAVDVSKQGYVIEYRGTDGSRFQLERTSDGGVVRSCQPSGGICDDGTWEP